LSRGLVSLRLGPENLRLGTINFDVSRVDALLRDVKRFQLATKVAGERAIFNVEVPWWTKEEAETMNDNTNSYDYTRISQRDRDEARNAVTRFGEALKKRRDIGEFFLKACTAHCDYGSIVKLEGHAWTILGSATLVGSSSLDKQTMPLDYAHEDVNRTQQVVSVMRGFKEKYGVAGSDVDRGIEVLHAFIGNDLVRSHLKTLRQEAVRNERKKTGL
jgi:hypothetical protein